MKLLTVVGARPQFVKAAALSRAVAAHNASGAASVREVLVHTGQHYDGNMSDVFFDEMGIPRPDHFLGVNGLTHGAMTGQMLEKIEAVLKDERPDVVLVYGDTNSTLAGALAAAKLHLPVAHVEAGLRSFNRAMPEEINRVLTDHAADVLFCPTAGAVEQMRREGVARFADIVDRAAELPAARPTADAPLAVRSGDVMYDVALHYGAQAEDGGALLARLGLAVGEYALATVHRAENTDDPARLAEVFAGLFRVAAVRPVVLPLHPRTRGRLEGAGLLDEVRAKLMVVDPLGYLDMVRLEKDAGLILTDSGGIQKEAFFHRVPCVTLRTETEWTELVDLGVNTLAPGGADAVEAAAARMAGLGGAAFDARPYGGGSAAASILHALVSWYER